MIINIITLITGFFYNLFKKEKHNKNTCKKRKNEKYKKAFTPIYKSYAILP